jgi:amidohydrolase
MKLVQIFVGVASASVSLLFAQGNPRELVRTQVTEDYAYLESLYKHLHTHPELSFKEENTSRRMAEELRKIGFEVSTNVGGYGVVGVLKNGNGPTVLLRADMDALPVKEQTGLDYASKARQVGIDGVEADVMHACGHDMHMTVWLGAARFLAKNTNLFKGTLVMIAQPAEERGSGAKAMLNAGLFTRFPLPNYCVALHVDSKRAVGKLGYTPGPALANVDSVDITIRGVGGHGAAPHKAKDPIVLAAQTVLALQTIVSREIKATDPAVLTVGSIHGGTKHNIIPDEVKLQLTLRSYSDQVRNHMIAAVERIVRGQAIAAGIPEDRLPTVKVDETEAIPATINNPELAARLATALKSWLGEQNVEIDEPTMGGEDFGLFGRTEHNIPLVMFWLGSVPAEKVKDPKLPSIHSPFYAPERETTIKTGVTAFAAMALELLGGK